MATPISPAVSFADALWTRQDCLRWSRHREATVRAWALEKLSSHFGAIPEAVIAERLDDPDPAVACRAISAARAQGLPAFADRILARYRRGDALCASACIPALAAFRDPRLLDAVRARLREATLDERGVTWFALAMRDVPGAESLLLEGLERRPAPDPTEMAALLVQLIFAGSPAGQRVAVRRFAADYDSLREGPVLEELLDRLEYAGTPDDFRQDLAPDRFWRASPVLEDAVALVFEGLWDAARLRSFRKSWRWGRYGEVIARCAEAASALPADVGSEGRLRGARAFVIALGRDRLDTHPPMVQRELAGLALLAMIEAHRAARSGQTPIPEAPENALELLLSDEVADLPEVQDRLIERLVAAVPTPMMVERGLRALRDTRIHVPSAAAQLVGRWRPAGGVDGLLAALRRDEEEALAEPIIDALVAYGEAALAPIDRLLAGATPSGPALWALDVLANLPCRRSAAILVCHFDHLWREDPERVLFAAESLGARELIEPLRRELREGEEDTAAACDFLEALHGTEGQRTDRSRGRRSIALPAESPLERESLRLALRCRTCGRTYHHDVREILVDPDSETPEAFIRDRLRCKGCGREGEYEVTPEGMLVVLGEMTRLFALQGEAGADSDEEPPSPVQFARMRAFGRRMNPRQAKAAYESRIVDRPADTGLRIGYGNVLRIHRLDEEALAQYREALRLEPLAAEAHLGIAQILEERDDLPGAIEAIERCVELGRRARLFHTKDRRGFPDEARESLEQLRDLAAFDPGRDRAEGGEDEAEVAWDPCEATIWERTGRNDPCPCGSGRKYKKCCLGKPRGESPASSP